MFKTKSSFFKKKVVKPHEDNTVKEIFDHNVLNTKYALTYIYLVLFLGTELGPQPAVQVEPECV